MSDRSRKGRAMVIGGAHPLITDRATESPKPSCLCSGRSRRRSSNAQNIPEEYSRRALTDQRALEGLVLHHRERPLSPRYSGRGREGTSVVGRREDGRVRRRNSKERDRRIERRCDRGQRGTERPQELKRDIRKDVIKGDQRNITMTRDADRREHRGVGEVIKSPHCVRRPRVRLSYVEATTKDEVTVKPKTRYSWAPECLEENDRKDEKRFSWAPETRKICGMSEYDLKRLAISPEERKQLIHELKEAQKIKLGWTSEERLKAVEETGGKEDQRRRLWIAVDDISNDVDKIELHKRCSWSTEQRARSLEERKPSQRLSWAAGDKQKMEECKTYTKRLSLSPEVKVKTGDRRKTVSGTKDRKGEGIRRKELEEMKMWERRQRMKGEKEKMKNNNCTPPDGNTVSSQTISAQSQNLSRLSSENKPVPPHHDSSARPVHECTSVSNTTIPNTPASPRSLHTGRPSYPHSSVPPRQPISLDFPMPPREPAPQNSPPMTSSPQAAPQYYCKACHNPITHPEPNEFQSLPPYYELHQPPNPTPSHWSSNTPHSSLPYIGPGPPQNPLHSSSSGVPYDANLVHTANKSHNRVQRSKSDVLNPASYNSPNPTSPTRVRHYSPPKYYRPTPPSQLVSAHNSTQRNISNIPCKYNTPRSTTVSQDFVPVRGPPRNTEPRTSSSQVPHRYPSQNSVSSRNLTSTQKSLRSSDRIGLSHSNLGCASSTSRSAIPSGDNQPRPNSIPPQRPGASYTSTQAQSPNVRCHPAPSQHPLPSQRPVPSQHPIPSQRPIPPQHPIPSQRPIPFQRPISSQHPIPSQRPAPHDNPARPHNFLHTHIPMRWGDAVSSRHPRNTDAMAEVTPPLPPKAFVANKNATNHTNEVDYDGDDDEAGIKVSRNTDRKRPIKENTMVSGKPPIALPEEMPNGNNCPTTCAEWCANDNNSPCSCFGSKSVSYNSRTERNAYNECSCINTSSRRTIGCLCNNNINNKYNSSSDSNHLNNNISNNKYKNPRNNSTCNNSNNNYNNNSINKNNGGHENGFVIFNSSRIVNSLTDTRNHKTNKTLTNSTTNSDTSARSYNIARKSLDGSNRKDISVSANTTEKSHNANNNNNATEKSEISGSITGKSRGNSSNATETSESVSNKKQSRNPDYNVAEKFGSPKSNRKVSRNPYNDPNNKSGGAGSSIERSCSASNIPIERSRSANPSEKSLNTSIATEKPSDATNSVTEESLSTKNITENSRCSVSSNATEKSGHSREPCKSYNVHAHIFTHITSIYAPVTAINTTTTTTTTVPRDNTSVVTAAHNDATERKGITTTLTTTSYTAVINSDDKTHIVYNKSVSNNPTNSSTLPNSPVNTSSVGRTTSTTTTTTSNTSTEPTTTTLGSVAGESVSLTSSISKNIINNPSSISNPTDSTTSISISPSAAKSLSASERVASGTAITTRTPSVSSATNTKDTIAGNAPDAVSGLSIHGLHERDVSPDHLQIQKRNSIAPSDPMAASNQPSTSNLRKWSESGQQGETCPVTRSQSVSKRTSIRMGTRSLLLASSGIIPSLESPTSPSTSLAKSLTPDSPIKKCCSSSSITKIPLEKFASIVKGDLHRKSSVASPSGGTSPSRDSYVAIPVVVETSPKIMTASLRWIDDDDDSDEDDDDGDKTLRR
ncbi:uncharacterized protein LOC143033877 [Oratosquilla oratoria]|uniref:uncharacterized protein LOC143033877 n=1 Tax=Oratosquilla oratoria TaxID=337810 RepID=UPI003F75FBA4